jgi:hypothetical protein
MDRSSTSEVAYTDNPSYRLNKSASSSEPPSVGASLQYGVLEPSCLGSCDVLNCCPTKSQVHSEPLYNRMIMCLFAISLMWLTSLQCCSMLASIVVVVPHFGDVYKSCESAYDVTLAEKTDYVQCVQSQLSRCATNLEEAAAQEEERVKEADEHNKIIVSAGKLHQGGCSKAFTSAR